MASTGSLFAHFVKFPGFEDVPTGLAALSTDKGLEGFSLIMFLIAGHEAVTWKPVKDPGSFGDPFQWKQLGTEMRSKDFFRASLILPDLKRLTTGEWRCLPSWARSLLNSRLGRVRWSSSWAELYSKFCRDLFFWQC
eukprot:s1277_g16.t1